MFFVYNFLQILLLSLGAPLLLPLFYFHPKYRHRLPKRLGFFPATSPTLRKKRAAAVTTFWLHALSVGEVTSARPLVMGLRAANPEAIIICSVTTRAGQQVAEKSLGPYVDQIIAAPLDLLWVITRYLRHIRPTIFILVETDFWPNWLRQLQKQRVPTMLVNGRISEKSFHSYQRLRFFLTPMFRTFSLLSMQCSSDVEKMVQLGSARQRLVSLGNLKYATAECCCREPGHTISKAELGLPATHPVWICGSTHKGEEELLLDAYRQLKVLQPHLILLIAPRHIARAAEIAHAVSAAGLRPHRRSQGQAAPGVEVFILDTIGELAACYQLGWVAFVGGSLVAAGGHNPLEPAACGVPVFFGPHMEDFTEIAGELEQGGGAATIHNVAELSARIGALFSDAAQREAMARAAARLVAAKAGVVQAHLRAIDSLLAASSVSNNHP